MLDYEKEKLLESENIIKTFFTKIAGQEGTKIGRLFYTMPLNYETDTEKKVVCDELPVLNLKNNNLERFEDALIEYVRTFFESERHWADPIESCYSREDKLLYSMHTIFLNLTYDDYERPAEFVKRYTDFLKDQTFEEFFNEKTISKISALDDCDIVFRLIEQREFQETPTAMNFSIKKGNREKRLPRIAFGIQGDEDKTAYIYGIQGYHEKDSSKEIKRINRKRYAVNDEKNIPEDYVDVYFKQEPYAYISLFMFLTMLKQKGITKVIMPAFLPERYEGKQIRLNNKYGNEPSKNAKKRFSHESNDYQRIQYNITQKFLSYMTRMTCDQPGISIAQIPDENAGFLVVDISKMQSTSKTNPIFQELDDRIEKLMQTKIIGEVGETDR